MVKHCGMLFKVYRFIEHKVIQGSFAGVGRSMRILLQIVMAKMLWSEFMPFWSSYSPACMVFYPYLEFIARFAATGLLWLLALPLLNLLLNTAVYGVASKQVDKFYGRKLDVENEALTDYFLAYESKVSVAPLRLDSGADVEPSVLWQHLHSAKIAFGYRNNGKAVTTFRFYGIACRCMTWCCSLTKCCLSSWIREMEEDGVGPREKEMFDHDPRFWQQPWQFLRYFVHDQSDGNCLVGLGKYFYTLAWKGMQLVKMTVGYWDHSLIDNMQIKSRADKLTLDETVNIKHEDMLASVGTVHSLIWQLLPYGVFLGNVG